MTKKLLKKSSSDESTTKAVAVPDKKELRKYTTEEARKIVTGISHDTNGLDYMFDTLASGILGQYYNADNKEKEKLFPEFNKKITEVLHCMDLDSHFSLMESVDERYRPFIKKFSRDLIKEHDCKTSIERSLTQVIASAFIGIIDTSTRFNNNCRAETITENRTKYMAMLSKQMDRANRQYLSALMTLKQLKSPTIEVSIKAKTAFVSQNQQINAPQQSNETNESK